MNPKRESEVSDRRVTFGLQPESSDNAPKSPLEIALAGREMTWLARKTGIPSNTLWEYTKPGKYPKADKAVIIAETLDTSVEQLFGGRRNRGAHIVAADNADWVNIPVYDLGALTDTSKGNRSATVPVRRDWLNRRLLRSDGLWLTELPSDYESINLAEGDVVICSDLVAGVGAGAQEGWVCIFRGEGGPFVARYSNRSAAELRAAAEATGETFVGAADLQGGDVQSIARIHGRMLARV